MDDSSVFAKNETSAWLIQNILLKDKTFFKHWEEIKDVLLFKSQMPQYQEYQRLVEEIIKKRDTKDNIISKTVELGIKHRGCETTLDELIRILTRLKFFQLAESLSENRNRIQSGILDHQSGSSSKSSKLSFQSSQNGSGNRTGSTIDDFEGRSRIFPKNSKQTSDEKTYFQIITEINDELVPMKSTLKKIQREKNGPLAIWIMEILSQFGPDDIPVELLRSYLLDNNSEDKVLKSIRKCDLDDSLKLLENHSLITIREHLINVPPAIQEGVESLKSVKTKEILKTIVELLNWTFSMEFGLRSYRVNCIIPSYIVCRKLLVYNDILKVAGHLVLQTCSLLQDYELVDHAEILAWVKEDLLPKFARVFGERSDQHVRLAILLAFALHLQNSNEEALRVCKNASAIALHSQEHWANALELENIKAMALSGLGRSEEAIVIYDKLIKKFRSYEGEVGPGASFCANVAFANKIQSLFALRRYQDAIEDSRIALDQYKNLVGDDYPYLVSTEVGLGEILLEQWLVREETGRVLFRLERQFKLKEISKIFIRGLQIYSETLGDEHNFTIKTAGQALHALVEKGDENEMARKIGEKLVQTRVQRFGSDDHETLIVKYHYAQVLARLGMYDKALVLFQDVSKGTKFSSEQKKNVRDWIFKCCNFDWTKFDRMLESESGN